MPDEFDGVGGVPDGIATDSQQDSRGQRRSWTEDEDFRAFQSRMNRAEEQNKLLLQRQAEQDALIRSLLSKTPPDEAQAALNEAEIARLKKLEEDVMAQQKLDEEVRNFYQQWSNAAREAGVDPNNPTFQRVLRDNWTNPAAIVKVIAQLSRGETPRKPDEELRSKVEAGAYRTIPEGRVAPDQDDRTERSYWEEFKTIPAGSETALLNLRHKYPKWREYQNNLKR